jgi:AAA+ ATPase superfamily predicted ATPase
MAKIIGRKEEIEQLGKAVQTSDAELIAVYGRRRIGKTYLIRNYYEDRLAFELTGMNDGTLKAQLQQFSLSCQRATQSSQALQPPQNWIEAFSVLEKLLSKLNKKKKWVVFFDEFPWLNSRKSGFLGAFEHFWNTWASRQANLIVIICGSAASWMIDHVVNAKGGLHNRITRTIRLLPFSLMETKAYLQSLSVNLDHYQLLQLYMVFGGVPHYLKNIERGQSATQAVNTICFSKTGVLRDEFSNLYPALFSNAENHIKIVRALSKSAQGMTRQEIINACKLSTGGGATDTLNELVQSGFIQYTVPFNKSSREAVYRLTDEFTLFYLRFMENSSVWGPDTWNRLSQSNGYKVWCGMSFEAVCLKHTEHIKKALGIMGVQTTESAWRKQGNSQKDGAQIDLVIDRADRTINLCEMKFASNEFQIDKSYAMDLERKVKVFREETKTKKTIFLTFITTYGVKKNEHADRLADVNLDMDILFNE